MLKRWWQRMVETLRCRPSTPAMPGACQPRRGAAAFVPLEKWLQSGWASEAAALGTSPRTKSHPPVELTVHGGVLDIARFTLNISHLAARQSFGDAAA